MDLLIQIPNLPLVFPAFMAGMTTENFIHKHNNLSFVIPGRVKRGPGIQNRERAALDSGFSYATPE